MKEESSTPNTAFTKYQEQGAYHYRHTVGARSISDVNPRLTARYVNSVNLIDPRPGERVLDAGSGEGVAALLCARRGATAIALEQDEEACRLGQEIRVKEGIPAEAFKHCQGDLYSLPFADEHFDAVISLEVIEHMDDVRAYLRELKRVLKRGGRIVVSTPLRRPDGQLQDPYHVIEFDADTLGRALAEEFAGVQVLSAWSGGVNRWYESDRPFKLWGQMRRYLVRLRTRLGSNPFSKPCQFDPGCALLLALAKRA